MTPTPHVSENCKTYISSFVIKPAYDLQFIIFLGVLRPSAPLESDLNGTEAGHVVCISIFLLSSVLEVVEIYSKPKAISIFMNYFAYFHTSCLKVTAIS